MLGSLETVLLHWLFNWKQFKNIEILSCLYYYRMQALNKLTCCIRIPKKLDTNQLAYSKLSSINRIMKTKKYIDKYDIWYWARFPGAATLSIKTLSIMTLSIMALSIMALSIMALSIMALRVMGFVTLTFECRLSDIFQCIIVLAVITLNVIMLSVTELNAVILSGIVLSVIMLSVFLLRIILLSMT